MCKSQEDIVLDKSSNSWMFRQYCEFWFEDDAVSFQLLQINVLADCNFYDERVWASMSSILNNSNIKHNF